MRVIKGAEFSYYGSSSLSMLDLLNNDVDGGYALLNKNKKLITIKHSSHLRILNHLIELLIICLFQRKSNKDENSWWNGRYLSISLKNKFIGDDDVCIYLIGYKPLKRLIGVLISSDFKRKLKSEGYIDVGDGCWIRNVLATTFRCWWRFWPFMSPTSSTFKH